MAKNNTLTLTQAQLNAIIAEAVAGALAVSGAKADKAPTSKKSTTKSTKKFAFTKHDGTVVYAKSQKQLDAWTAYANRSYVSKEEREERFAEHKQAMQAYKPSKALKDAIRKDRASITFAVAKEQYGFVGTKQSLKALKAEVLSK
jgi:hypothetical protein